jgi:glycerol-3-phosphate acyltransferase PlsY
MTLFFLCLILNYLLGSIPVAFLTVKLFSGKDIRKIGSGNSGATNVTRALGVRFGIIVFVLDFFKGYSGVLISERFFKNTDVKYSLVFFYISIAFVLIGHIYSVFLNFRGGKGAASGIGIVFALSFYSGIAVFGLWALVFYISGIVSLATITASVFLPVCLYYFEKTHHLLYFGIIASIFVILKHISNIKRLIRKEENSFRRKK